MATTVGHALCGIACIAGIRGNRDGRKLFGVDVRLLVLFVILANLPDIDLIFGYVLHGDAFRYHWGPTHSLGFALIAGAVAAFIMAGEKGWVRLWLVCSAAVGSHVLLDLVTGPEFGFQSTQGLAVFWPFSDALLVSPVTLLVGPQYDTLERFLSWHNVGVVAVEIMIFLPLAGITRVIGRRRASVDAVGSFEVER